MKKRVATVLVVTIGVFFFYYNYNRYSRYKIFQGETREITRQVFFNDGDILELLNQNEIVYKYEDGQFKKIVSSNDLKEIHEYLNKRWWNRFSEKNRCGLSAINLNVELHKIAEKLFETDKKINVEKSLVEKTILNCFPYRSDNRVSRIFSQIKSAHSIGLFDWKELSPESVDKLTSIIIERSKKNLKKVQQDIKSLDDKENEEKNFFKQQEQHWQKSIKEWKNIKQQVAK